tara:strand:+ start:211 stop:384 length:174 start_codon:yes stop_codon:yes gene_type:complete
MTHPTHGAKIPYIKKVSFVLSVTPLRNYLSHGNILTLMKNITQLDVYNVKKMYVTNI